MVRMTHKSWANGQKITNVYDLRTKRKKKRKYIVKEHAVVTSNYNPEQLFSIPWYEEEKKKCQHVEN